MRRCHTYHWGRTKRREKIVDLFLTELQGVCHIQRSQLRHEFLKRRAG